MRKCNLNRYSIETVNSKSGAKEKKRGVKFGNEKNQKRLNK